MADFDQTFRTAYGFDAPGIDIGNVMKDGKPLAALPIRIPLAMMNRHGLIAGSTGTGKTRTLQLLGESLSRNAVPVFLADVKGDLAGLAFEGQASDKILALTGTHGTQVRADTQQSVLAMVFKYCDESNCLSSISPICAKCSMTSAATVKTS